VSSVRFRSVLSLCTRLNSYCCEQFRSWRRWTEFSSSVYDSRLPVPRRANQRGEVWKYVLYGFSRY